MARRLRSGDTAVTTKDNSRPDPSEILGSQLPPGRKRPLENGSEEVSRLALSEHRSSVAETLNPLVATDEAGVIRVTVRKFRGMYRHAIALINGLDSVDAANRLCRSRIIR